MKGSYHVAKLLAQVGESALASAESDGLRNLADNQGPIQWDF
jgi:hypothetical protein